MDRTFKIPHYCHLLPSLSPLIAETVYASFLLVDWGCCTLKWIEKSTVYKVQHNFFFVHFIIFLRMEQHKRKWSSLSTPSFHVGFVFLDAGRFYNILSRFSIVLPVVETEVSWIIDIIGQYACLSMIGEEYHLFWKILCYLSSFLVFSFSNLAQTSPVPKTDSTFLCSSDSAVDVAL